MFLTNKCIVTYKSKTKQSFRIFSICGHYLQNIFKPKNTNKILKVSVN